MPRQLFHLAIEEGYVSRTPFRSAQGDAIIHIKMTKPRTRRFQQDGEALGQSSITMTNTYLRSHTKSLAQAYHQRTAHRARQRITRVE